jgi:type IV secretion system protein VirB1
LQNFYLKSAKDIGQGQESLKSAISAYNTGNFDNGFANGYVAKVTQGQTLPDESSILAKALQSSNIRAWSGE